MVTNISLEIRVCLINGERWTHHSWPRAATYWSCLQTNVQSKWQITPTLLSQHLLCSDFPQYDHHFSFEILWILTLFSSMGTKFLSESFVLAWAVNTLKKKSFRPSNSLIDLLRCFNLSGITGGRTIQYLTQVSFS